MSPPSQIARAARVAVVGGGISGLAAARLLSQGKRFAVTVFEETPRFGGNLPTVVREGFQYDVAGDSWVRAKPHAEALARELGLGDELVVPPPVGRGVSVLRRGLHPMPDGLVLGVPTRRRPIAASRLLSPQAKLRVALESDVPPRVFRGDDDESVFEFFARRFGAGYASAIAGPLLGGISAGDASLLSVRAAFPQLVAVEQAEGSLTAPMTKERERRAGAGGGSPFLGLLRGMGSLVRALVSELERRPGVTLRTSAPATSVAPDGEGYRIAGERFDAVVLTGPLPGTASRLQPLSAPLAEAVRALVEIASTAIVVLAFDRAHVAHPLASSGFIVAQGEPVRLLAATFLSTKWPGRTPDGKVLVRAFYGGARDAAVLERTDEELGALAGRELSAVLGITAPPLFADVHRFDGSSPQMTVGYPARRRRLEEELHRFPRIALASAGFAGVGISDVVRQAGEAAARLEAAFDQNSAGSV